MGNFGEYFILACYIHDKDATVPEKDKDKVLKLKKYKRSDGEEPTAEDINKLFFGSSAERQDYVILAVDYTELLSYSGRTASDYVPQYLCYGSVYCESLPEYSQPDSSELPAESSLGDCAVRIPLHAKKAILEVSAYSKPYEKQIEPEPKPEPESEEEPELEEETESEEEQEEEPITVIVQDDYEFGVYTAPSFNQLKTPGAFNVDSEIYESSEYSSTNYQPTFKSGANNVLNPGVDSSTGINEVQLLGVKSPRSSSIVEVPMYIEPKTGKLMFSLRLANIKPSPDNSFVVKLIGYSM